VVAPRWSRHVGRATLVALRWSRYVGINRNEFSIGQTKQIAKVKKRFLPQGFKRALNLEK
jgi:hypothetical protein